jgi:hypothetical protein
MVTTERGDLGGAAGVIPAHLERANGYSARRAVVVLAVAA